METNSISASLHCSPICKYHPTTGWCKEMEISIYILSYTLWRICRLEPYGSVLMHLSSGHPVKCLPSGGGSSQASRTAPPPSSPPSPSQFPCKSSNELSKLANGGKMVILLILYGRAACSFRGWRPEAFSFSDRDILHLLLRFLLIAYFIRLL